MEDTIFWIVFLIAIYFAPSILAGIRKKKNTASIFIVNFFFGWTLIGWVIALTWAFSYEESQNSKIEHEVREGHTKDSTIKSEKMAHRQFGIAIVVLLVIGVVIYGIFNVGGSASSSTASSINLPTTSEQMEEAGENKVSLDKLAKGFYEHSYMPQITYTLTFVNNTEKDIRGFEGIVTFSDIFDNEIDSVKFSYDEGLKSHYEVTIEKATDYNRFVDSDVKLKEIKEENLKYNWKVTTIVYDDGSKVTY